MPYNNLIARSGSNPPAQVQDDVSALIPEDVSKEIIRGVVYKSAVMRLFKKRQMAARQQRMPVLATKPIAYFVSGDTGLKQTTEIDWTNVYLNAEEIACIVPVPENVLDDVASGGYNLWDAMQPDIEEALAVVFDEAVLFGVNAPATYPTAIATAAVAAGNTVTRGTGIDFADNINTAMGTVETDGYVVNGHIVRPSVKSALRGLRSTTNELIFQPENSNGVRDTDFGPDPLIGRIWSEPAYVSNAGFNAFTGIGGAAGGYEVVTGDFNQGIIGIRSDMTMKRFDTGVIQDANGAITLNLLQQDAIALRVVMRVGFAVPNPVNRVQPVAANRYPFGVVKQAG